MSTASGADAPALPDGYEILQEIGRGPLSIVWLALNRRLGRVEALKRLDPPRGRETCAGLLAGARAAARLEHPNILPVYETFELDGVPYVAMEHAPGGSLRGAPLEPEQAVRALGEALEGLAAAGRVHGDLKPENLLLDAAGRVRLADFGMARASAYSDYAAPEQVLGDPEGRWTDLYALGVIAEELLADDADPQLGSWVRRLTAHEPADRLAGPLEALRALQRIAGEGYVTYREPVAERPLDDAPDAGGGASPEAEPPEPAVEPLVVTLPTDDAEPVPVEAGGECSLQLRARNQGTLVARYTVAAAGIPEGWWTARPAILHLNPWGQGEPCEGTTTVSIHPPRDSSARAGRWPVTLTVTDEAGISAEVAAAVVIRPFHQLEAGLRPEEPRGRRQAALAVELVNRGNAGASVHLEARDAEGACTFSLARAVEVPAGESRRVAGSIRARRRRWFGAALARRFAVVATPAEAPAQRLDLRGVFWQQRLLPWWPIALALALLAAAAAIVLASGEDRTKPQPPIVTTTPDARPSKRRANLIVVPNVVGRSAASARDRLESAGLELGSIEPAGLPASTPVKRQTPKAGKSVEPHTAVDLVLDAVEVPDLTGVTLAQAREQLEAAGLELDGVDPFDAVDDATVTSQTPDAGEQVAKGTGVDLVLAEPEPEPASLTSEDAENAAQRRATIWAGAYGATATAEACEPDEGGRWACTAAVDYTQPDGSPGTCTLKLEAFPTTDIAGVITETGFADARVTDDSDCLE